MILKEKEEVKRIKSTLRSEMLERIQKIEKVAGTHLTGCYSHEVILTNDKLRTRKAG